MHYMDFRRIDSEYNQRLKLRFWTILGVKWILLGKYGDSSSNRVCCIVALWRKNWSKITFRNRYVRDCPWSIKTSWNITSNSGPLLVVLSRSCDKPVGSIHKGILFVCWFKWFQILNFSPSWLLRTFGFLISIISKMQLLFCY